MFRCPECSKKNETGQLKITALVRTEIDVAEDESVDDYQSGDLEWNGTDPAECTDCGWSGTVDEMTVAEPDEDDCELDDDAPGDIDDDGITDPDNERGE